MYTPPAFKVTDEDQIEEFCRSYGFATLVTSTSDGLAATHVPVVLRTTPSGPVLVGHVARANSPWASMDGEAECLAIFNGPHAYVSPSWYANSPAVPTWNYAVVHAHGFLRAKEDREFMHELLRELSGQYENHRKAPWRLEQLEPDVYEKFASAIVCFEMRVTSFEAKFKLGQNRRPEDRIGTIMGLAGEGREDATELAEFMRRHSDIG